MAEPAVIVVGAGPAGVRAAEALSDAGIRPVVIDEGRLSGGQIYRRQPDGFTRTHETIYGTEAERARSIHACFDGLGNRIDYRPETLVWHISDGQVWTLGPEGHAAIPYDALILCTGATDRLMPVKGWHRAGNYSLGGSQIALKAQACAIGSAVVFLGSGPLLYLVAAQYVKAGAKVAAVLDTAPFAARIPALPKLLAQPAALWNGILLIRTIKRAGVPILHGITPVEIVGDAEAGVGGITVRTGDGRERHFACDAVAMGHHLRPETQLADLARCDFAFEPAVRQWLPVRDGDGRASVKGVYLAGDGARILGARSAEASGRLAALAALHDLGFPVAAGKMTALRRTVATFGRFASGLAQAFPWPVAQAAALPMREHHRRTVACRRRGDRRARGQSCQGVQSRRHGPLSGALLRARGGRGDRRRRAGPGRDGRQAPQCRPRQADHGRVRRQGRRMTGIPSLSPALTDVLIIGAGIMGSASAFFLRQRGLSVTMLETDLVGRQASGTNFGNVRRQGRPIYQLPLANRSIAIWRNIPALLGTDVEYLQRGHMRVCYRDRPEMAASMESYAADAAQEGLDLEILSGNALRARFPFLGPDVLAASLSADCGHANPRLAGPAFARAAQRHGAVVHERCRAINAAKSGDDFHVVTEDGREFRAPVLLITAGAWAKAFVEGFGETVPLTSRGPNMCVTEPLPYAIGPSIGVATPETLESVYFRQVERGNLVIGGSIQNQTFPDDYRVYVKPQNSLGQWQQMQRLIPAIARLNIIRTWSGIESYLPDSQPVMGPSPSVSGLFYAFGFSGAGFQVGPGVGATMAELIATGRTDIDLSHYRLGRFAGQ